MTYSTVRKEKKKNNDTENDFHANKNRLWNKNEQKKNDFHRKTKTIVECACLCKVFQQPILIIKIKSLVS